MINGETVEICCSISQPRFNLSKIFPLRDAAFGADCLTPFRILKTIVVGLKMDSGNAIKNCYSTYTERKSASRLLLSLLLYQFNRSEPTINANV